MIAHLLPQRCDVYRRRQQSDGKGGYQETFALLRRAMPCRLNTSSTAKNSAALVAGRPEVEPAGLLYAQPKADLRSFDRIVLRGQGYEIAGPEVQADGAYLAATATVVQGWSG